MRLIAKKVSDERLIELGNQAKIVRKCQNTKCEFVRKMTIWEMSNRNVIFKSLDENVTMVAGHCSKCRSSEIRFTGRNENQKEIWEAFDVTMEAIREEVKNEK